MKEFKEFMVGEQHKLYIHLKCSINPFVIDILEISKPKKFVIYEILTPYNINPVLRIVSVPGFIMPDFHDEHAFMLEFKEIVGNKVHLSLHEDKFPIDSYDVISFNNV